MLSEAFQDMLVPSFTFGQEERECSLLSGQQHPRALVPASGEYTFFTDDGRTVRLPPPSAPFARPAADAFHLVAVCADHFLFHTEDGRAVRVSLRDGAAAVEDAGLPPSPADAGAVSMATLLSL